MSDVTIASLGTLRGEMILIRQRYAALLAELQLLVREMQDFGDPQVTFYANQLAAELAKHLER
jgi:hypothetical protein